MKPGTLTATSTLALLAASAWLVARPHLSRQQADGHPSMLPSKAGLEGGTEASRHAANAARNPATLTTRNCATSSGDIYSNIGKAREEIIAVCETGNLAERYRGLDRLLENYTSDDFLTALEALPILGFGLTSPEVNMVIAAWMEKEPEVAVERLAQARGEVMPGLLRNWAESDPEAAMAWISSHRPELHTELASEVIAVVMKKDPGAGRTLLEGIAEDKQLEVLRAITPRDLGIREPVKLEAWIAGMPEKLREEAVAQMLIALPGRRTTEKLEWLGRYPELTQRFGQINNLYNQWMLSDKAAAIDSAKQLEAGPMRNAAFHGIYHSYLTDGNEKASFEILELSMPEFDEQKLDDWLNTNRSGAPLIALEQVPRLSDENRRKSTYRSLLETWRRADPQAAEEWMSTHEIPEDVRRVVLDQ